jgi:hypothetical protein
MESFAVWAVATAVLVGALLFGRGTQMQRKLRLGDINWKAALVFAAVLALLPAFFVSQLNRSTAEVPSSVSDESSVAIGAAKQKQ